MGIHFDKALDIHPEALKLRAERTKVLASNIANETTPGYQARDVDFRSALAAAADEADFPLDDSSGGLLYRVPNHPSRDGNTVELGVEQAEFSQNVSEFQTSLTFLNMQYKGLAKVIAG
ncbi:flagellar basal-body rod protein FlgB [Pseudogulbenkiania sp. NH8B]|uniref:Flagellar basal body rod protein FlgB n=1 Tax=Pseudogulbenkiania ferrooxidans 2002 TaxID=279714 RepID=B9Z4U5_9NEIS|nr:MULTISPECIES: flagellar basal body rod protein FlgB [Pseudogulbenkiania]EEG08177.1 flagellar basal-body rod protein FlgB [Pseudogulbenkiania ferrooxidans 2002]BAK77677.1 flagellar basal-body rod protein FlgB [Pseudogulbenkiania sp. NH8B]